MDVVREDWTEKYRPRTLSKVLGNKNAIEHMKKWGESWKIGVPKKKALILVGRPGIGKTTAAHALANDMGWGVIEMNASDSRNYSRIRRIAMTGAMHETFTDDGEFLHSSEGKRKLIILDEADNLYEKRIGDIDDVGDAGGKRAIVETIMRARQPMILIVNDYYNLVKGAGDAIRNMCEIIKFNAIGKRDIKSALQRVVRNEGVNVPPQVIDIIVERSDGDMRAAINDLQALCEGESDVKIEDAEFIGMRDTKESIFRIMARIFKTTHPEKAVDAVRNADEDITLLMQWIDENIPLEYKDLDDMDRAYYYLARADIFLGRVRRRRYYGFWRYAYELMSGGVAVAKKRKYQVFTKYSFPTWLRKAKASKPIRDMAKDVCMKIGKIVHASSRKVRSDFLNELRAIYRNDMHFAVRMTIALELNVAEVSFIVGKEQTSAHVKKIMEFVSKGIDDDIETKKIGDIGEDDKEEQMNLFNYG